MPFKPYDNEQQTTPDVKQQGTSGFKPYDTSEQQNAGQAKPSVVKPSPSVIAGGLGLKLPQTFFQKVGQSFEESKQRTIERSERLREEEGIQEGMPSDPITAAKQVLPFVGEAIGTAFDTVVAGITSAFPEASEAVESAVQTGIEGISKTELGGQALETLADWQGSYDEFAEEHPDFAGQIEGGLKVLEVIPGVKAAKISIKSILSGFKRGKKFVGDVKGILAETGGEALETAAKEVPSVISSGSKKTAIELMTPTGKKAGQKALAESRVVTPKTKLGVALFGEKTTPSEFQQLSSDFIAERIPKLSNNRSNAIGQINEVVGKINKDVSKRAIKLKATTSATGDVMDTFLTKADDIAANFDSTIDSRWAKVHVDRFQGALFDLNKSLSTDSGNVGMIREARIKWDNTPDFATIKNISADEIVGKPAATQRRWQMWRAGRDVLNNKFFDLAAEQGDDLMKKSLKDMSLGIRSIDEIAKNGEVKKSILQKYRREIISAGLTGLGLGTLSLF